MVIDGWGDEGQRRLKEARVCIAGMGGLGSPVALYLTAAGVGTLRLVDHDVVELSNLNRQVLYTKSDVGRAKVNCAEERLRALNPEVRIEAIQERIAGENGSALVDTSDVIVDAMDNFPARFLLNEAAVQKEIPFVHGAIWGLGGQVTVVVPGKTPCLACLFSENPPPERAPVLGTAPGVIGCIQATEVLKLLTGIGNPLFGRLLLYDGEFMEFSEVRVQRKEDCPVCGQLGGAKSFRADPDLGLKKKDA
jgi:adenylyltransferase/sulfurtransferase